jgi:hypothetical protein
MPVLLAIPLRRTSCLGGCHVPGIRRQRNPTYSTALASVVASLVFRLQVVNYCRILASNSSLEAIALTFEKNCSRPVEDSVDCGFGDDLGNTSDAYATHTRMHQGASSTRSIANPHRIRLTRHGPPKPCICAGCTAVCPIFGYPSESLRLEN